MKKYKHYIDNLSFKDYEKTNCFVYELIMRNEECQNELEELHKLISEMDKKELEFNRFIELQNTKELDIFVKLYDLDKGIKYAENIKFTFLEDLLNFYIILNGATLDSEYAPILKNFYLKKLKKINHYSYLIDYNIIENLSKFILDISNEKREGEISLIIKAIAVLYIKIKYDEVILSYVDESLHEFVESIVQYIQNNILIKIMGYGFKLNIESLEERTKLFKYIDEKDFEKYSLLINDINKLYEKIYKKECYLNSEFYLDFQKELYLDYDFFSDALKNNITNFYKRSMKKEYNELNLDSMGFMRSEELLTINRKKLKNSNFIAFDKNLIEKLDSINIEEKLIELLKENPTENHFSFFDISLEYKRPKLYNNKFKEVSFSFNPNIVKSELMLQFESIVDAYQDNKLNLLSTYELLGEQFDKWTKKISRTKRNEQSKDSKTIISLLNKIPDLLFIYDSSKAGISHTQINMDCELSLGTISSNLNFMEFLIDGKGYKLLLCRGKRDSNS